MARWLRVSVARSEDQGWASDTRVRQLTMAWNSSSRGSGTLFWLRRTHNFLKRKKKRRNSLCWWWCKDLDGKGGLACGKGKAVTKLCPLTTLAPHCSSVPPCQAHNWTRFSSFISTFHVSAPGQDEVWAFYFLPKSGCPPGKEESFICARLLGLLKQSCELWSHSANRTPVLETSYGI